MKHLPKMVDEHPRRIRIDHLDPTETAILKAQDAVERAGAHPHLTAAGNLLSQARERVADFLEGVPEQPPAKPCAPAPDADAQELNGFSRTTITKGAAERLKALGIPLEAGAMIGDAFLTLLAFTETQVPKTKEQALYQVLVNNHGHDSNVMTRLGTPTANIDAAEGFALTELQRHTAKEAFVVRVHSAFVKEVNFKKAI